MTQQDHISRKRVVYTIDGMDAVTIRRDVEYGTSDAGPLTMDLYYPPGMDRAARLPAVVFVTGFADRGTQMMVGCKFKEMGAYLSWAELVAASGMIGITYANEQPDRDALAVLTYVREHAQELQIDATRIGIWSGSGNVPNALALSMRARVACAALFYAYTLDLDGATDVAGAQAQFRFVNASAGRTIADLPREIPLFIARAGQDQMPGLNAALDRFIAQAISANLPLTVVNHPSGPHAFELFDDSATSREIVRQGLAFLRFHLGVPG
jgi:acetyl esterase/lipase